ncbi:MAG: universal stress protein [Desulfosarcina sp.]
MNPQIKKILFATDLSAQAPKAFGYAVSLADHYQAKMVILHVMEETSPSVDSLVSNVVGEERLKALREESELSARDILIGKRRNPEHGLLRQAIGEMRKEMSATAVEEPAAPDEIVVTKGNVVEEVLQTAKATGCDMIVMWHYARSGLSKAVLGSATRGVIRQGRFPVLLVNLEK